MIAGAAFAVTAATVMMPHAASAETRSLKLYYVHTGERAEITFKKDGRYLKDGLQKLNVFLRDWRRNEPTKMDPRLFDLVWQVYRASGSSNYITVVSAYRSPATNSMLRSKTSGVAKNSQHTLGKAMDFFIPGVPLTKLRHLGVRYQIGGVGFYPKSGSPFVHMDVGGVRAWPRLSRKELLALFPDGKTVHIPADGKPLPGYKQAMAEVERRKSSGSDIVVASAAPAKKRNSTLFGALFGGGADEEEDVNDDNSRASTPPARRPATAAPRPSVPTAAPAVTPTPAPTPAEPLIAALPTRNVPLPVGAPRPAAPVAAAPQEAPAQPAQPDNIPFAVAAAPEVAPTNQVAHSIIPVPGRKPVTAVEQAIAMAASVEPQPQVADTNTTMLTGFVPVPVSRPSGQSDAVQLAAAPGSDAIATLLQSEQSAAAKPPVPAGRTTSQQVAAIASQGELIAPPAEDDFVPARAVPATRPVPQVQPSVPVVAAAQKDNIQVASLGTQSRTTAKSAKPTANRAKANKAAVVQPATAPVSQLAMSSESVANAVPVTNPVLRNDAMREAPAMVYTAGFQRDIPSAEQVNSFSGQAVTFMSVAKFKTAN
ncbi:DUF882 domain-containing protein [Brucellaceae bacterium C25G]